MAIGPEEMRLLKIQQEADKLVSGFDLIIKRDYDEKKGAITVKYLTTDDISEEVMEEVAKRYGEKWKYASFAYGMDAVPELCLSNR